MKPVFSSINLKKSATVLASGLLLTLGSAKLQAAPIIEKIVNPADQLVSVNYVGSNENTVTFHVALKTKQVKSFGLLLKMMSEMSFTSQRTMIHISKRISV